MVSSSLTITMSPDTVDQLAANGFTLYAFKAVASSIKGQPTVWIATTAFGPTTEIAWTDQYSAYTSVTQGQVVVTASYAIEPGEALVVTSSDGTGNVADIGIAGAIGILSQVSTPFTCGIGQESSGGSSPLCALPLFGNNLDLVQPADRVLLMFASEAWGPGTTVSRAYAPALLVDMTGVTSRTVSYDINSNWQANTDGWATQYPAASPLAPILIAPLSPQLAEALAEYEASRGAGSATDEQSNPHPTNPAHPE